MLEEYEGQLIVTGHGVSGNPGRETISNWFKIEKFDQDYKLVFCPTVCDLCRPVCGDIGVKIDENDSRRLTIRVEKFLSIKNFFVLAPSEFIENPAQGSKAPLTLSWEWIPRLDSGVRASDPVGFPCQQSPDQVRDIDGNLVRSSAKYYILPVFRGRGGGLTLAATRNISCPLDVVQENMELIKGLPLAFIPVNPKKGIIRESTDLNIIFSASSICIQSNVWMLDRYEGELIVTGNGKSGNPGPQTISNWFKIEKFDKDYKLVFCPTVCNFCKVVCGDIGVKIAENGKRRLAISDVPFKVMSALLTRDLLPKVKDAHTTVSKEETHRSVPESFVVSESKLNATSFAAKSFNNTKSTSSSFTSEQMQKLLSLINDNTSGSIHANMADSGANQHLIVSTVGMINVVDITSLNITVGYPNGTLATISHLTVVNKLIRDSKMYVGFDEDKCYIQDLKREKILGTGILSVLHNDLNISKNASVPVCEVCHKAKQTSDPFPLSSRTSKNLGLFRLSSPILKVKKAYKLLSLDSRNVFYSRDVKFYETVFPFKMKSKNYDLASETDHLSFFDNQTSQSPYAEGRATSVVDGSGSSSRYDTTDSTYPLYQEDNTATQVDNQSSSKGNNFENVFGPNQNENVFNQEDVQTPNVKRSSRPTKLPAKFNDYVVGSNVKYGLEKYIEALNKNNTWSVCNLPVGRKPIGCINSGSAVIRRCLTFGLKEGVQEYKSSLSQTQIRSVSVHLSVVSATCARYNSQSSVPRSNFGFAIVIVQQVVSRSIGMKLCDHIDEFNKLILDLENIDIEIKDEDHTLMLLTLPSSYENFVKTLLYGRESLTMEDVLATLNSRELKKRTEGIKEETGDKGKIRSFRDSPIKKSSGFVKKSKRDQDSDSFDDEGNAYFGEALVVVRNDEITEFVMDLGGSYDMTHRRDFLYDFKVVDGGSVHLGDNRTCTIKGTWKVKIKLHDGSSFILEDVRYVSGLRRSLILFGTLEKEGYTMKMQMGRIKVIKSCQVMMTEIRKKNYVYTLEAKVMNFGVQKHGDSKQLAFKQVGFKQLGVKQGAQGKRESEVFQVSNDDVVVAQRRLEEKKLEEKTNTDCLVKEQENVHLGIKVGANIMVTGVPGQEGAKGGPRFEVLALDEDAEHRLCISVTPKVEITLVDDEGKPLEKVDYSGDHDSKDEVESGDNEMASFLASKRCMTRSSTKELFTPFKDLEREFRSSRKHFKKLSLDESRLPDFDLFSDQEEYSEEEVAETMAETMEQYMRKTRADYGSGVARPKIEDKDNFKLKDQFLKELGTNTFSGSDHENANEHIEKVLEIVDLFHIPNITIYQVMLKAFPMSLTGAASRWIRNKPSGSTTTWEDLKITFLRKYCPPARTAKKIEEINNFQQESDETSIKLGINLKNT
ncbi:zinc finger, CCHC-type containing protein [Tanacetum coccineum]